MRGRSLTRLLVWLALAGLAVVAVGAILLTVSVSAAVVLLVLGAGLVFLSPLVAAVRGAEMQFHPDHRVEGRTFLIDLFRSTDRRRRPPDER